MKKSFLVLSFLTVSVFVMAQETTKQREVGLVFSNLDQFGLTYKTGTQQSMWRFNSMLISGNNSNKTQDSSETKSNGNRFNLKAGKEFRKTITPNLEFRCGADISFGYSFSKSDLDDKKVENDDHVVKYISYYPGINLVLGFNYIIHDKLVLGAEVMPYFGYDILERKSNPDDQNSYKSTGFSYGLSNSSALLSVSYRF